MATYNFNYASERDRQLIEDYGFPVSWEDGTAVAGPQMTMPDGRILSTQPTYAGAAMTPEANGLYSIDPGTAAQVDANMKQWFDTQKQGDDPMSLYGPLLAMAGVGAIAAPAAIGAAGAAGAEGAAAGAAGASGASSLGGGLASAGAVDAGLAAGAGAGAFTGAGAFGESSPYWSMGAEAGTGTLTDASVAGAGTLGSAGGAIPAGLSSLPAATLESLGFSAEQIAAAQAAGGATAYGTAFGTGTAGGLASSITPAALGGDLVTAYTGSLAGAGASGGIWDTIQKFFTPNPTSAATSALSRILNGSGTGEDYLSLFGKIAPAALGAYASNQQSNQLGAVADKFASYGAPYREKLGALYANPSSFLSSPEVQVPVQQGTDMMARSLSVKGNPAGSGNALQQLQSYSSDQLFGRLGQEKDRLAGFGGLSAYNQAAPAAATAAVGSNANVYNAIGGGIADVFSPPKTAAQQYAELIKAMRV